MKVNLNEERDGRGSKRWDGLWVGGWLWVEDPL